MAQMQRAEKQQGALKDQGDVKEGALPQGQGRGFMKIRDLMTPNPECIDENESLKTAALKMKQANVGVLPVCRV